MLSHGRSREDTGDADLTEEQKEDLLELRSDLEETFADRPEKTFLVEHNRGDQRRAHLLPTVLRLAESEEILNAEIHCMIDLGIIVLAESEYTSLIMLVEVPRKEKPRPCIDYRKFNAITRDQLYPIPNLEERVETFSRPQYVSTVDLIRGDW